MLVLTWTRFWEIGVPYGKSGHVAAIVASVVLLPVIMVFVTFALFFYRKLSHHKYERTIEHLVQAQVIVEQLNTHENLSRKSVSIAGSDVNYLSPFKKSLNMSVKSAVASRSHVRNPEMMFSSQPNINVGNKD